jgi:phosphoribosylanthranilate isomerase
MAAKDMKVKICGLTCLADAQAAIDAGADLLGFNFYPPSRRYLEPGECARLVTRLPAQGLTLVGVFVNASPTQTLRLLAECGLHLAQLSGDEPPETLAALDGRGFKAIRPQNPVEALRQAANYAPGAPALPPLAPPWPALLVDTASPGQYGGSGQTGDWQTARLLAARYPILLAGGLRPGNVDAAVRLVRPWGVDVASGVEASPGRKDPKKMAEFVAAARRASLEGR